MNAETAPISGAMWAVLLDAQALGFIGTGVPLHHHIRNAIGFATLVLRDGDHGAIVDLGSGGGLPGLVLAELVPTSQIALVERSATRAQFLRDARDSCALTARVQVIEEDAAVAARRPELEATADVVTARSFAAPATTAECACRFLRPGGRLVVSEPPRGPTGDDRWSPSGLGPTGLVAEPPTRAAGHTFRVLRLEEAPEARIPRSPAATRKRRLF